MRGQSGHSTIEYIVGAGVVAAIAVIAFIHFLLPAEQSVKDHQPPTYYGDYYRSGQ